MNSYYFFNYQLFFAISDDFDVETSISIADFKSKELRYFIEFKGKLSKIFKNILISLCLFISYITLSPI